MIYELWDTGSRNLVGAFETEAAAVEVAREALHACGRDYLNDLELATDDARGVSVVLATGESLYRLVQALGEQGTETNQVIRDERAAPAPATLLELLRGMRAMSSSGSVDVHTLPQVVAA